MVFKHLCRICLSSSPSKPSVSAFSILVPLRQTGRARREETCQGGGIGSGPWPLAGRLTRDARIALDRPQNIKEPCPIFPICYQQQSVKEMKTYAHEVDLSEPAKQSAKLVEHEDLSEALKRLVFSRDLTSPDDVRTEVIKQAKDYPISNLFGASVIDGAGRVTSHLGGIAGTGADETAEIEGRMFRHAAQFIWAFRAQAFIEPARRQIWLQHTPQERELDFLVVNNPFVPSGHEGIFTRGLYYGLCGDMLLAAHLLAPQIENSLRYVLESNGVDISNLESDLTQPVKTLGPLLSLPQTAAIFGADCVFELRGLLIEKLGYSFRHRVAHGFVSEAECYSAPGSNLWWIALRLCYTPLALREINATTPTPESKSEKSAEK